MIIIKCLMCETNAVAFLTVKWINCGLSAKGAEEIWVAFPGDSLYDHGKVALCSVS